MKKLLYFAVAFASLTMVSCGSKTETSANAEQQQECKDKPFGDRPERPEHPGCPDGKPAPISPEEMVKFRVEKMSEVLNLTDEQKQKVTEFYTQQAAKFDSTKAAQKEQKKEEFKAMHEEEMASLKSILTEEQLAKFDTMKVCPKFHGGPHHGGPKGGPEGRPEGAPDGPHHGGPHEGGPRH